MQHVRGNFRFFSSIIFYEFFAYLTLFFVCFSILFELWPLITQKQIQISKIASDMLHYMYSRNSVAIFIPIPSIVAEIFCIVWGHLCEKRKVKKKQIEDSDFILHWKEVLKILQMIFFWPNTLTGWFSTKNPVHSFET